MNADHDVERLISGWLHETAVERAPDRVLEQAGQTIDGTRQRREAAWRNRMSWSMPRMIAAGVAIIAIALGGGLIGRSIGDAEAVSASATPAIASSPVPGAAMASYRLERNLICASAQPSKDALSQRYGALLEPDSTAAQRADGILALEAFIELTDGVVDQLAALDPPPEVEAGHAANVTQYRDMLALLRHMVGLQRAGKFDEALVVDRTTEVIAVDMEAFERVNQLTACP